jgi:hypothetical protein
MFMRQLRVVGRVICPECQNSVYVEACEGGVPLMTSHEGQRGYCGGSGALLSGPITKLSAEDAEHYKKYGTSGQFSIGSE